MEASLAKNVLKAEKEAALRDQSSIGLTWEFIGKNKVVIKSSPFALIAASKVFSNFEASEVYKEHKECVSPCFFSALIRFVHTGELDPEFSDNMSKLIELFRLAKSYGIKSLKNLCFAQFKEFLQPENIWKALNKSFEVKELRTCCEELLATRTIECLHPMTFNGNVPIYLVKHFLKMKKLNIPSEYLLVETMLRMNEQCRSKGPFKIALPYLRLLTLNEAQL